MPICKERYLLGFEMSEVQVLDRSVLVLIDHCNEMKRQESISRIVTCFVFVVFSGIFFLFLQTHSSLDCKHNKNDLEHSTSAHYQPEIESRPNAHLTALNCSMQNTEYLEWETRKGDAHLHMFNYSNKALIAPQDGNYSIYLQITYRMYEDYHCNPRNLLQLKQEVFHRSDRYPDQTVLMMALDSINCSEKTWRKSLYMSRVFSLEKGDQLKVKVGHLKLIDCNEKKVFFGAFLI
ncbi:tumor necrosis factor ligand superfamily member 15-like isoform X1 [Conger conger]|uniref:tumor necrosis factor ligand superfamily member 15-like isoform X1 n=2 Tax=Conger conger TaxID=82655 RepID=UPI002A5A4136|nr:tumor necrosis factor ligand superfamily member 15-like isoform X1 [Conger conger]